MKRSRSGIPPQADAAERRHNTVLLLALLLVIAFVLSFVFGLRGRSDEPGELVPDTVKPQPATVADVRPRVEVLNASGKSGVARAVTAQLRDAGFDVVGFGNAPLNSKSSVLDRVGKPEVARAVAGALSIAVVETKVDSSRFVEASVLLGSDWVQRAKATQQQQQKRWWERLLKR